MHSIERIIQVLERASLVPYADFSYRVIADQWRDSPLSAIGAVQRGGRYNAPYAFPVLYSADSQMTALLEAEALFTTPDGQLQGVPRDPDLLLTIQCNLLLSRLYGATIHKIPWSVVLLYREESASAAGPSLPP